ncbi:MAG: PASTA domain-containing protein [Prevotella sp.]
MKTRVFLGKLTSRYVWGNLIAMAIVIVGLCFGVKYGLEIYTHHGEGITVPNIKGMKFTEANYLIEQNGLRIIVSDSGYNRRLPADFILAQSPGYGTKVKEGHTIYVTVNSPSSPTFAIPDIIDNSSVREATAKLTAMGFKLLNPKYVDGEKDWVYGVICRGRRLTAGDRVPIEHPLTLIIGDGKYTDGFADFDNQGEEFVEDGYADNVDEFEEVTAPPSEDEGANEELSEE